MEIVPEEESVLHLQHVQRLEAIGTMTTGVAHDFNNLLTAILGNVQLAKRKLEPGSAAENSIEQIEKASHQAVLLTNQLLAFSRRQQSKREPLCLNHTIAEILTMVVRIIGKKINISTVYDPRLSMVFANSSQIEQLLINLCINARDAMPDGGKISIETSAIRLEENFCRQYQNLTPGRFALIRVRDNGTGMDKETIERIFEPFYTTKEMGKGTGLGLSMARTIIEQHHGHINVRSAVGKGATFDVLLPAITDLVL